MNIKQFNGAYLIADDRLLFRISANEDVEYRFWLTRRVVLFILAATNHLISNQLKESHSLDAIKALIDFEQEAAKVGQTDSNGKLSQNLSPPANQFPIGFDPVLVTDVKCILQKDGLNDILILELVLPAGGNLSLSLAGTTLHAMCALLKQLSEVANWGALQLSSDAQAADAELEKPKKNSENPQLH
jgi:hypothetical protein